MCLAVPMRVVAVEGTTGKVESGGVETEVSLDLTPDASPGDYVLIHAGFAIQRLDAREAKETLAIFARLEQSWNES